MASGLQCPSCGHVHPAGLPEIARGDTTFRCYGCYRTLSVPEGWTGRPTPRPSRSEPAPGQDAPPGAGTRDARSARLAGRRGFWPASGASGPPESRPAGSDAATEMVPIVGGGPAAPGDAGTGSARPGRPGSGSKAKSAGPLGWVAPRRSGGTVPAALRALVWAAAFGVSFVVTAFVLRQIGLLSVNTAIDLYVGSGLHRFGVLLLMLPLWAVLSATLAHFSLEALARRRRPAHAPPAETSTPV
jgi:hypothetical protein